MDRKQSHAVSSILAIVARSICNDLPLHRLNRDIGTPIEWKAALQRQNREDFAETRACGLFNFLSMRSSFHIIQT